MSRSFYFGAEAAAKYGNIVSEKLKGRIISKRIRDDKKPGSIRYEADALGIEDFDLMTLLETLEGMCHIGTAKEIEDGLYKVL